MGGMASPFNSSNTALELSTDDSKLGFRGEMHIFAWQDGSIEDGGAICPHGDLGGRAGGNGKVQRRFNLSE